MNTVIHGDCHSELKKIQNHSIDLILTDPPYQMSDDKTQIRRFHYETLNEEWDKDYNISWVSEIERLLKPTGQVLIFCSQKLLAQYLNILNPVRQILHWERTNPVPALRRYYWFSVEYILWKTMSNLFTFEKKLARQDVFNYPTCAGHERYKHPTQKPLELIKQLVQVHSTVGDVILDPFAGTGTCAVACKQLGREFILIEKEEQYINMINQRLSQEAE